VADSLSLREFLGLSLEEGTPDHSTLSKTRRLMNLGTHKAVFRWVLKRLAEQGLLSGKNLGVDATTLEANAALRSIVRRDNGASYEEHVTQLMQAEGMEEPTPVERQRFDRKRKKSLSNREWVNPHDQEARITKMKDGRTHLAYKAEHAVDLETGAVVALTVQPGDRGDTTTMRLTLAEAGRAVTSLAGCQAQPEAVGPSAAVSEVGVERVVGDKGYHSKGELRALAEVGVAGVIAEPERKRQNWTGQASEQAAVYANRRRLQTKTAKALMRRRGELIERSFAHLYDTGGMRRVHLRKKSNIAKRALIHAAAFNLSLILRRLMGIGTARQAADLRPTLCFWLIVLRRATEVPQAAAAPARRSSCRRRNDQTARPKLGHYPRADRGPFSHAGPPASPLQSRNSPFGWPLGASRATMWSNTHNTEWVPCMIDPSLQPKIYILVEFLALLKVNKAGDRHNRAQSTAPGGSVR